MATNDDSSWEVIDGLQRLTTMINFVDYRILKRDNDESGPLKLKSLEKIPSLNGAMFEDLPSNLKLSFLTRPIRITVLNDRSDHQVRFDLFERLNTGGIILHEQEIRNCVFQGAFNDFIKQCAKDVRFNKLIRRSDKNGRGNVEELALKFFAYFEYRGEFRHPVKDFLNEYMEKKTKKFDNRPELTILFESTVDAIHEALPNGIVRSSRPNSTPLILFEAVFVGCADIISQGLRINGERLREILDDEDLKSLTTGATNSLPKLRERIDYVSTRVRA